MTTFNEKLTTQWKDAGSLLLGIWLAVSPWALAGTIANLARASSILASPEIKPFAS